MTELGDGLTAMTDMSVGDWIGPRLGPFGGWVGSVVPRGFPAYARVLHPVDARGPGQTWAQVCASTGATSHALMQWEAISSGWDGGQPSLGRIDPATLGTLVEVLAGHSSDERSDEEVYLAVWIGHGDLHGSPAVAIATFGARDETGAEPPRIGAAFAPEVMNGPTLSLPFRDYFLFRGPLRAAVTIGNHITPDWFVTVGPNLMWPPDHSWFVATEIDFDSTLVGGSSELIATLLRHPGLEVWPVEVQDNLMRDGDQLNGLP